MFIQIYTIKDALEAAYIRSLLDEQKIPYRIIEYSDSAYSGLLETKYGFGILEAPEEYKDKILDLLNDQKYKSETSESPKLSSGKHTSFYFALFFLATTILFGFLYLKSRERFGRLTSHKNSHPVWDYKNHALLSRWNKGNILYSVATDANHDFNFEDLKFFDADGNIIEHAFDKDEDGICEKKLFYNKKGELKYTEYDLNADLRNEKSIFRLNDHLFFVFDDTDADGEFDKVSFTNERDSVMKSVSYQEYKIMLQGLSK